MLEGAEGIREDESQDDKASLLRFARRSRYSRRFDISIIIPSARYKNA